MTSSGDQPSIGPDQVILNGFLGGYKQPLCAPHCNKQGCCRIGALITGS